MANTPQRAWPAPRVPPASSAQPSKPIEDYALIGNMISAALVGRDGSIDWLCLPRFDSAACFAALLGGPENGRWLIAPEKYRRAERSYVAGTAVLETLFTTEGGEVAIVDFMPLTDDEEKLDVVRIVRGVRGEVDLRMELVLRFNYGQTVPWVRRRDYGLSAIAGPDAVELHTDVPIEGRDLTTCARATACRSRSRITCRTSRRTSSPIVRRASIARCRRGARGRSAAGSRVSASAGTTRSCAR
jgi:hypothetical protein